MYRVPFFNDLAINYSRPAFRRIEYPRYGSGCPFSQKIVAREHHNHNCDSQKLKQDKRFYFANYVVLILRSITVQLGIIASVTVC